jgi:3-methyladenine DNA glycosylase/8-oxoguanine DNA glycosylase
MYAHDFSASEAALRKLPHFHPLIKKHGPVDLTRYHRRQKTIFQALLRSIVYQQISGKAAASILARVEALFPKGRPTPALLLKLPDAKLRAAGLSGQKVVYVRDLAAKCLDGTIDEKRFPKMSSEEIIAHLVQVKGIGVWTAQMLLIFTLYRPDILPWGDLAIQKGFRTLYKLRSLPDKKRMEQLAKPWRQHASAASWYLWRIADMEKPGAKKAVKKPRR